MNLQPPEKKARPVAGLLDVHSIFYTIQGEGPFAGTPAVFIRLAGCNLQCPMCDTEYTSGRRHMAVRDIMVEVINKRWPGGSPDGDIADDYRERPLVVITGGEPFRQDLTELIDTLVPDFYVQVETNGTLRPCDWLWNTDISQRSGAYIVVSPKTGSVHKLIWEYACAVKYVGAHDRLNLDDGLPELALGNSLGGKTILARPPLRWKKTNRNIYLQPMDWAQSRDPKDPWGVINLQASNEDTRIAVIRSCMKHGYVFCLQVHKVIGVD